MSSDRYNPAIKGSFLDNTFRALEYRNFRLFFIGQGISLIGTWMQQIAMSWLVYRLTGSALILGVVAFSSQIPTFILSPIGGVLADRWDRRRIIIVMQALAMAQAFVLALLTLTGLIEVWHIVALGIILGCINSLDIPARQSFIIDMVERKELLGNAIALNSFMFNFARLIGPSAAGIFIAAFGEGICFLINGLSFIAVLACLFAMRLTAFAPRLKHDDMLLGFKEGFIYTFGSVPIRHILTLLATISITGMSYVVLMPVFAKDILGGGPHTLGFLMASVGIGAALGTLYLASRKQAVKLSRIIPLSSAAFGIGLVAFSVSGAFWASMAILVYIGFGFMVQMASCNTVLQTIVDDDKRGRVMSFYTLAFMGTAPLGSLLAGALAERIGAPGAIMLAGFASIGAAFFFARRLPALKAMVSPIYEKIEKGIG